jgi:hypothetical protein
MGLYTTSLGLVTVGTPSNTLIARILLRELAAEGKA